jgi:hypothetical protein
MNKKRISRSGFLQTVSSYLDINYTTLQDWLRQDRNKKRSVFIRKICSDLENAQRKVMEKWEKNPELLELVAKTKSRWSYKSY